MTTFVSREPDHETVCGRGATGNGFCAQGNAGVLDLRRQLEALLVDFPPRTAAGFWSFDRDSDDYKRGAMDDEAFWRTQIRRALDSTLPDRCAGIVTGVHNFIPWQMWTDSERPDRCAYCRLDRGAQS